MSAVLAICALLAAVPSAKEMRGPFPIMSTPYHEDGAVDYEYEFCRKKLRCKHALN